MIISRTPFRLPLGGGSTDLPSYYEKYGGFIFGAAINLYFDVFLRQILFDSKFHLQYSSYEAVDNLFELKHHLTKEALAMVNIDGGVDITFKADALAGTGLGSSGSCTVGLLNCFHAFKGLPIEQADLAEKAFKITQNLGWPDGKQDPYLAALGGFTVLEIGQDGSVSWRHPEIKQETIDKFLSQTLLFYTGVRRHSFGILQSQSGDRALELKHRTKEIGRKILFAFEHGNLDDFGALLNEHWYVKKAMSDKISTHEFDEIYEAAIRNGALGGKLIGAGGGGYFMFYCPADKVSHVTNILKTKNLRPIPFAIDNLGTRVKHFDF